MGYIAESSRKFFHPAAIDEMLSTFVPLIDGTSLNVRIILLHSDRHAYASLDHPRLSILHAELPPHYPPSIILAHALSHLALAQFVHVRRAHAAFPL